MDRALLRCAIGEVLHSPTPARVAIAEWVELARTYSGDPMRRLMNGVLGRIARDTVDAGSRHPAPRRESVATTYDRLKKIVVEQLGVDEDEVKPEASFVDDLNADSLDLVELIMSLEEEFGTEISDEDAEKIRTVQDAVDYIDERVLLGPRPRPREPCDPAAALAERLGLPSATRDLLAQALVHTSWLHEHPDAAAGHNERLEFLGDAVVNLADLRGAVRRAIPTTTRASCPRAARRSCRTAGLARLADRIDLGAYLLLGEGEAQRGGRRRPSLLASAFEAARRRALPRPRLRRRRATGSSSWPRPELAAGPRRSRAQEPQEPAPGVHPADDRRRGRTTGSSRRPGPDHEKLFRIEVVVDGAVARRRRGPVAAGRRDRGRRRRRSSAPREAARRPAAERPAPRPTPPAATGRRAAATRRVSAPARLLALRLQGFKSFAERTIVEFGPGISAVVGPNGSGKSNLADALRWALGEQGRALRTPQVRGRDLRRVGEAVGARAWPTCTLVLDNARRPAAGRLQRARARPAAVPLAARTTTS